MEETWQSVCYKLFQADKLNIYRCRAIMGAYSLTKEEILAGILQEAIRNGDSDDIKTISTNLVSFVEKITKEMIEDENDKKKRDEFIRQFELEDELSKNEKHKKFNRIMDECRLEHPLPDNAIWMICTENSEHFVKTSA